MAITYKTLDFSEKDTGITDGNEIIYTNPDPQRFNVVIYGNVSTAGNANIVFNFSNEGAITTTTGLAVYYSADKTTSFYQEVAGAAQIAVNVVSGTWESRATLVSRGSF